VSWSGRLTLAALLVALCGAPAGAQPPAEIYGQVWFQEVGRPAAGAVLSASGDGCNGGPATADAYGNYVLAGVRLGASCQLTVEYRSHGTAGITIHVLDARTDANLELRLVRNQLLIKRR
jgi:hypothetical protein